VRALAGWLSLIITLSLGVAAVVQRFSYPDATETRLFLDWWYVWVGGMGSSVLLYLFASGGRRA
jgi:hypothetical protein